LPAQYGLYLSSLLHGDFGPSFHWRDFSVNDLFAHAMPISLRLGGEALGVSLVCGLALGVAAAARRSTALSMLAGGIAFLGIAVPSFVIAPVLQLVFGLGLRILPVGGWNDGAWQNQVLPVATLALPQIAIVARLAQASFGQSLASTHIRTLRAFGLPQRHILLHAGRAAMMPILSYLGSAAAGLLTGSIIVETTFGIPGMGRYFVDGALGRDYTLVMGTVIVVALLVILFNLIVDLLYALIDPRIRHE